MASLVNVVLGALPAAAFWMLVGYALARYVLPPGLPRGAAPVLGWAVHSALALPILQWLGFSSAAVGVVAAVCVVGAGLALMRPLDGQADGAPALPVWAFAGAAILALAPAAAILPKYSGDAVYLADPIFDHAKIAIIDAMSRQGLPPVDPVFAAAGAHGQLFYYYLWHFSAAELALLFHVSGWEVDIALTWFSAFASLCLLMAVAVWLGKKTSAALLVLLLATAASLRGTTSLLFGSYNLEPFLDHPTGFAGWLFQAAWAPQHLMAASCVVVAMLLIARYAVRPSAVLLLTIALVVAAGFESSTYVGGVIFVLAALAAAPFLIAGTAPARRLSFVGAMAVAAALALGLAAPFLQHQFAAVAARGDQSPIVLCHFAVLGSLFPEGVRRVLDLPAYWLLLLPIEFPASFFAGVIALVAMLKTGKAGQERLAVVALACVTGAGLAASWLLASTLGDNNDLGLRAALPAICVLIAAAAAGVVLPPQRRLIAALAIVGVVLALPDSVRMIRANIVGKPVPDGVVFARSPELWAAVRRYAGPADRVANNPLFLQDVTPWPVNISWALLADRNSCFAGRELVLALAPLPPSSREAINAQFIRVFAGAATAADVNDMANKYGCDVVAVVPQDGAWEKDPFAASPDYRLAESRDGRWRIYLRAER